MPLSKVMQKFLLGMGLLYSILAGAEDIDLFQGKPPSSGNRPNILIIIDNSANWARNDQGWEGGIKQGEAELDALINVLGQQRTDIRLGLMMFTEGTQTNGGGYLRFAIRDMDKALANSSTGSAVQDSVINAKKLERIFRGIRPNFNSPVEKVSAAQTNYSNVMYEAYRYFAGGDMYARPYDKKRDFTGNGAYNTSPYLAGNIHGNALSSSSATQYRSPLDPEYPCGKNYIIFIGNGFPSKDTAPSTYGDTRVNSLFDTRQIYASTKANFADEWARFLRDHGVEPRCTGSGADQICTDGRIHTFTIDVYKDKQDLDQTKLLQSMANAGGGEYFAARSTAEIQAALNSILAQVDAVDSVFTSASLPVSVNTQGTYLNQVYMGVFRPDGGGRPRWVGNLKQYRFGLKTNANGEDELYLADSTTDSDGKPTAAVNAKDGFIRPSAHSYWSSRVEPGFWQHKPKGVGGPYDAPDGDLVEKGGAAQKLRAAIRAKLKDTTTIDPDTKHRNMRKVYTCVPNSGCASEAVQDFHDGNDSLKAALGYNIVAVNLSRQGPTVTATYALATSTLPLTETDTVTISGAVVPAYNETWSVTRTSNGFTFTIPETPATPATGSLITVAGGTSSSVTLDTLTFDSDPQSATYGRAKGYVAAGHGFSQNQSVTIAGANQSAYNGTYRINRIDAFAFDYTPVLPTQEAPAPIKADAPADNVGTASCDGTSYTLLNLHRKSGTHGSTVVAVTSIPNGKCTAGKVVSLSNVTKVSGYNGNYEVMAAGSSCPAVYADAVYPADSTFCFTIELSSASVNPASPATGTIAASGLHTRNVRQITRTAGDASNIATVTLITEGNHGFPSGTSEVFVSGADQSQYNGRKSTAESLTFYAAEPDKITYTVVTGPVPTSVGQAGRGYEVSPKTLIDWVRGLENKEDENGDGQLGDVRAHVHGDVLHSRPVLINYGKLRSTDSHPLLVAFYGGNDGMLHAARAGNAAAEDGRELWSFVSSEHYQTLGRLYRNLPMIKYPNTPTTIVPTPTKRNYYFDGNIGVFQTPDQQTTHIFAAMRRGGRAVYALDVSKPYRTNTDGSLVEPLEPAKPKFLWKRNHLSDSSTKHWEDSSKSIFTELGFTFSEPKVIPIKKPGASCNTSDPSTYIRALVFGAGYDRDQEDLSPGAARAPKMGRGVFVLDAATGKVIQFLKPTNPGTWYSFAADITLVDADSDTCVDRLYAADTGGNIHRYDIITPSTQPTDPANPAADLSWKGYHIARLATDTGENARKFLFPVDAVMGYENLQQVFYLLGGTGDRETPRDTFVKNHFYMVKDTIAVGTADSDIPAGYPRRVRSGDSTRDLTEVTNFNGSTTTLNGAASTVRGWFIELKESSGAFVGEKVVNAPLTVAGVVYFATNVPVNVSSQQCSPNLGEARGYAINFMNGTSAAGDRTADGTVSRRDLYALLVGGGLPPSPVTGIADVDGKLVRFIIGSGGMMDKGVAVEGHKVEANPDSKRTRVYWYFKKDQ